MWIYCVASADGGAFKLLTYQLPMVVHVLTMAMASNGDLWGLTPEREPEKRLLHLRKAAHTHTLPKPDPER